MNIDIRKSIMDNFSGANSSDIRASVDSSISLGDEVTLPGMGVFFEILWNNSTDDEKEFILNKLEMALK